MTMKLTKQRKAYGVVLGLGLTALVVDRVFLGGAGPGAAAAAPAAAVVEPASPAPAGVEEKRGAGADGLPVRTLAARLEAIRPGAPSREGQGRMRVQDVLRGGGVSILRDRSPEAGLFATRGDWLKAVSETPPAATDAVPVTPREAMKDVLGAAQHQHAGDGPEREPIVSDRGQRAGV